MHAGASDWASRFFGRDSDLQKAEQALRAQLDWNNFFAARRSLLVMLQHPVRGLDLLDYCLWCDYEFGIAEDLQAILYRSGSAWKVGRDLNGRSCLEKRVDSTVEEAARREMEKQGNAAMHLQSAWHHAYRRNPDPSKAFSEAVKAVEAAARPVVSPKDQLATMGRMIGVMKATPQKWGTVIGEVDTVRMMMGTIWKSQVDRHGTDDPNRPPVKQPEAEAAVQIAVTLVHLFRTRAIHSIP